MAKFQPGDVVSVEVGFSDSMHAVVLEEALPSTEKIRIITEDGILSEAAGEAMLFLGINVLAQFVGTRR